MKPEIHPSYRPVVFQDQSSGDNIIIGSTMETSETITLEGVEYPLAKVELSSRSHPFFTGQMKIVDTAGRVERFERRYDSRRKKSAAPAEEAETSEAPAPAKAEKAEKAEKAPAEPEVVEAAEAPAEAEAAVETEAPAEAETPAPEASDAAEPDASADES